MSKRTLSSFALALVLGLFAAACGSTTPTAQTVKSDFVPQTVDFLDDVGRGVSLALDADGNPHMAYLGLVAPLSEGEIPPAHAAAAPAFPAVLTASQKDGIFSHGFVVQTDISSTTPKPVPLTTGNSTGIAVGQTGSLNVVWTQSFGVFFATAPNDIAPFGEPQSVSGDYGVAPAVAVDSKGNPWVAYIRQDPTVPGAITLQAASLDKDKWNVEQVADLGACDPAPCPHMTIGMAVVDDQPVIAYSDSGGNVLLARFGGTAWSSQTVASNASALGASLAVASDGTMHVAFATTTGEVRQAMTEGSAGAWKVSTVARYTPPKASPAPSPAPTASASSTPTASAEEPPPALAPGTAVGIDPEKGTVYVAWTDPQAREVRLATSPDGTSFSDVDTPGTSGGETPALAVNAESKAFLAWYDADGEDLLMGTYPEKDALIAAPAPSTPYTPPGGAGGGAGCAKDTVEVTAPLGAAGSGFSTTSVEAPSGGFQLCFNNEDTNTHNVAIYQAQGAGSALAKDDPFSGPKVDTFEVSGLNPGDYFFQCDVHPATMTGTLTVK